MAPYRASPWHHEQGLRYTPEQSAIRTGIDWSALSLLHPKEAALPLSFGPPRHSIEPGERQSSTFLEWDEVFLKMARRGGEASVTFRPHPLLVEKLVQLCELHRAQAYWVAYRRYRFVIKSGRPVAQVALELQINEGMLGNRVQAWRSQHPEPEPERALSPVERQRASQMEKELRQLSMENELQKATAFFDRTPQSDSIHQRGRFGSTFSVARHVRRTQSQLSRHSGPVRLDLLRRTAC